MSSQTDWEVIATIRMPVTATESRFAESFVRQQLTDAGFEVTDTRSRIEKVHSS